MTTTLEFSDHGLCIKMRRSKTDQEGQGRTVAIPSGEHPETCPIRALQAWLAAGGISAGLVFRSVSRNGHVAGHAMAPRSVAKILKRAAIREGIDPAAIAGATEHEIAALTGHRSREVATVYS
jgi:hypothetical protein